MSAKHTPAPWAWTIHDVSTASLGVGDAPGMGTPLVLSISPCRSCIDHALPKEWEWGRCTTPSEADARLIAAAPELLAALKEALYAVTEIDNAHKSLRQIRAAIAKAEGR